MPSDSLPKLRVQPPVLRKARRKTRHHAFYGGVPKFSQHEIKEALRVNFGNARMAAEALNDAEAKAGGKRTVTRETVSYYIETRGWTQAVLGSARESLIELAEHRVITAIRNGDTKSARWLLEKIGASRGYGPAGGPGGPNGLMLIDPAALTTEQLLQIFDPQRLTAEQLGAVLSHLAARFEQTTPLIEHETAGEAIDHEPFPEAAK